MDLHQNHLLATCKAVDTFGTQYAADFPDGSVGAAQFAIIHSLVPQTGTQAAQQVSGGNQFHAAVNAKTAAYNLVHADLVTISDAAHSLALLGTAGLEGKFHLPRSGGAQALLNAARAFQTDATGFTAGFASLGLDAAFFTAFGQHITNFEGTIKDKGGGQIKQGGATGALADSEHRAAAALHILNTVVRRTYKNNPQRLAEWLVASHVERHTPVPHAQPVPTPTPTPAPK